MAWIKHWCRLAAVGAPLLCRSRYMRLTGVLLLSSYLVSRILYKDYLISVWCYFAAAISMVALISIIQDNRNAAGRSRLRVAGR